MTQQKLKKGMFATDIHFGRKSNSPLHNQDCLDYLTWFCDHVRSDPSIHYVAFLGDWHENRSALNISTMDYSYRGAKMLNDLGLPVYFVIGNHDLYHKNTRDVYSVLPFNEFNNFIVVDSPILVEDIMGGALFSPYLFDHEYPELRKYLTVPFWAGHFEFKGFRITGYNVIMPAGPDPDQFEGPDQIFTGHFHQRQTRGNITFIGNCFPMDYGDAGDVSRGLAWYDHSNKTKGFIDWANCPKYVTVTLSQLLSPDYIIPSNAHVRCGLDVDISQEDLQMVRDDIQTRFSVRELLFEEISTTDALLTETVVDVEDQLATLKTGDADTIDQLIIKMLESIKPDGIDPLLLTEEYKQL